jgi:hypothetical protein
VDYRRALGGGFERSRLVNFLRRFCWIEVLAGTGVGLLGREGIDCIRLRAKGLEH